MCLSVTLQAADRDSVLPCVKIVMEVHFQKNRQGAFINFIGLSKERYINVMYLNEKLLQGNNFSTVQCSIIKLMAFVFAVFVKRLKIEE